MQLTLYADYSLRVLIFLAEKRRKATIKEIADFHRISRNHLTKVVHQLGKLGYVDTQKGSDGGVMLRADPARLQVSEVVRAVEPHFNLVECFNLKTNTCPLASGCRLKSVLGKAQAAFLTSLAEHTIQDLITVAAA